MQFIVYLVGLPRVIPDEILLFSLCLISTTIISKTVAFNCTSQYWTLVFQHRFKKNISKEWIQKLV